MNLLEKYRFDLRYVVCPDPDCRGPLSTQVIALAADLTQEGDCMNFNCWSCGQEFQVKRTKEGFTTRLLAKREPDHVNFVGIVK